MICRHADMCRTLSQQLQDGADHAPHRRDLLAVGIAMRWGAEEVSEQLVSPVDEMHLHGESESVTDGAIGSLPPACRDSSGSATAATASTSTS